MVFVGLDKVWWNTKGFYYSNNTTMSKPEAIYIPNLMVMARRSFFLKHLCDYVNNFNMTTIIQYKLEFSPVQTEVTLPGYKNFVPIDVQFVGDELLMWAVADVESETMDQSIYCLEVGEQFPKPFHANYIATVVSDKRFVLHLFHKIPIEKKVINDQENPLL